jgi:hypothetical protein
VAGFRGDSCEPKLPFVSTQDIAAARAELAAELDAVIPIDRLAELSGYSPRTLRNRAHLGLVPQPLRSPHCRRLAYTRNEVLRFLVGE